MNLLYIDLNDELEEIVFNHNRFRSYYLVFRAKIKFNLIKL